MKTYEAWVLLLVAGILEIVWALALKQSHGFTRLWPSAIGLACAVASFVLLAYALKALPVGTAYAAWVGIGVAGVALVGMAMLGEPASWLRLGCVLLILIGVAGLKATAPP